MEGEPDGVEGGKKEIEQNAGKDDGSDVNGASADAEGSCGGSKEKVSMTAEPEFPTSEVSDKGGRVERSRARLDLPAGAAKGTEDGELQGEESDRPGAQLPPAKGGQVAENFHEQDDERSESLLQAALSSPAGSEPRMRLLFSALSDVEALCNDESATLARLPSSERAALKEQPRFVQVMRLRDTLRKAAAALLAPISDIPDVVAPTPIAALPVTGASAADDTEALGDWGNSERVDERFRASVREREADLMPGDTPKGVAEEPLIGMFPNNGDGGESLQLPLSLLSDKEGAEPASGGEITARTTGAVEEMEHELRTLLLRLGQVSPALHTVLLSALRDAPGPLPALTRQVAVLTLQCAFRSSAARLRLRRRLPGPSTKGDIGLERRGEVDALQLAKHDKSKPTATCSTETQTRAERDADGPSAAVEVDQSEFPKLQEGNYSPPVVEESVGPADTVLEQTEAKEQQMQ